VARCVPPARAWDRPEYSDCAYVCARDLRGRARRLTYATHADAVLAPLDRLRVVALGKLVSLRDDGYGEKLWLASIEPMPDE
jgi:hypothetical protein